MAQLQLSPIADSDVVVDIDGYLRDENGNRAGELPIQGAVGGDDLELILEPGKFLPGVVEALIGKKAGVEITHVPYRGGGPAMNDLLGGNVDMLFDNLPGSLPGVRAGLTGELGTGALCLAAEDDGEEPGILEQLMALFKENHGRDPTEAEVQQWRDTLREAAEEADAGVQAAAPKEDEKMADAPKANGEEKVSILGIGGRKVAKATGSKKRKTPASKKQMMAMMASTTRMANNQPTSELPRHSRLAVG